jgi:glycosyltransferase involved in cell wall biosynthesis
MRIVDNNSTDDTNAVAEEFAERAPLPTRCVFEPQQGSSFARNRAVAEARGNFILFIDDDAVAEPRWASAMIAGLEERRLDAACGMVIARWGKPPPRWLGPSVYIKLAVHNEAALADAPPAMRDSIHNYFSANVGFRRATLSLFGGFREELGVVGNNPMSGEDTELFKRILRRGGAIGFVPGARVYHVIPPARMTRRYLRRKAYAFGWGSAIEGGPTHNHLDKLGRNALRMITALIRGDSESAVFHELECANFMGFWRGQREQRRARRNR